jgi:hypothetical protein
MVLGQAYNGFPLFLLFIVFSFMLLLLCFVHFLNSKFIETKQLLKLKKISNYFFKKMGTNLLSKQISNRNKFQIETNFKIRTNFNRNKFQIEKKFKPK